MARGKAEGPRKAHERGDEIVAVDCFPARLRMIKPLVMSTYRIDDGPVLYVRVRTRSGAEGWGEAAANPIMSGETLKGMIAVIEAHLKPKLLGASPFDRVAISQHATHQLYSNGAAKAAVDMALLDAAGHIAGVPAVDLLGGATRRQVRVLRLAGGSGDVEKDVAETVKLHREGFTAFKLKVGVSPVEREGETVRLVRAAVGPKTQISADANMGWDVVTACRYLTLAAPHGLAFLEQPVPPGPVGPMAAIARSSSIPLGADEGVHGYQDIAALAAAGAIGGASLKTVKLGGLTPLIATAYAAHALGLSINLAMLMESSLASAAMVHAACAVPNVDWGLSLGVLLMADDPVVRPITCDGGMVRLPDAPGLGVSVDERAVRALAPE